MLKSKRHILSWLFIGLLIFTNLRVNLMFGLYAASQDLFVEMFCENKDHPEMECDGSCMLDKLGSHSHDDHSEVPPIHAVFQLNLDLLAPEFDFEPSKIASIAKKNGFFYQNTYAYLGVDTIDRPPILV